MSVTTLNGRNVVITGVVPDYTRVEAEQLLAANGAHIQGSVTRSTDILVIGAKVGARKIDGAKKWNVPVITWADALALLNGTPVQSTAPPAPPTNINQPVAPPAGKRQIFPMLCKKADGLPTSGDCLYEIKWDGYRAIAWVNGATKLASRTGKDFARFDHIRAELDQLVVPCILDGEIVVLDEQGRSSFERLHKGEIASAKYVVFDVLEVQDTDTRTLPLRDRKELLEKILEGSGFSFVTASPVFEEAEREQLLAYAVETELEGIVAKRADSIYKEKSRDAWWKIKLRLEQEFVLVGYTEGKGNRKGTAGALLLAVNGGSKTKPDWVYCGSAGSGGTYDDFQEIVGRASPLDGPNSPTLVIKHDLSKAELRDVTWVKPELVVQVKFQRWTDDGKLWHPSIQGVRDDKNPKEVVRET